MASDEKLQLVVRRFIAAPPERLFGAWISPEQLKQWWGPAGVECVGAQVDARVGGHYRIDNRQPDGSIVIIRGVFLAVKEPSELLYTWRVGEDESSEDELVRVRFERVTEGTEIIITHEKIASTAARDQHERGWDGCLDGLYRHIAQRS